MTTRLGVVHHFSGPKGFGAILDSAVSGYVFCHFTEIVNMPGFRCLQKGQRVQYELCTGERGPFAKNVEVVL